MIPSKVVHAESAIPEIEEEKMLQNWEKQEITVTEDKRKSYMGYTAITKKSSPQYKLQERAITDEETGIRMVGNRYCVATGSRISHKIGTYIDVKLENGEIIECIISDAKANKHTKNNHLQGLDGSTIEFIVDTPELPKEVRKSGDVSSIDGWESKVVTVVVYKQ